MTDYSLITCEKCGREWDGNAQCNCFYGLYSSDDELFDDYSPRTKDQSTQTMDTTCSQKSEQRRMQKEMKDSSPLKLEPLYKERVSRWRQSPTPLEKAQKAVDEKFKVITIQVFLPS